MFYLPSPSSIREQSNRGDAFVVRYGDICDPVTYVMVVRASDGAVLDAYTVIYPQVGPSQYIDAASHYRASLEELIGEPAAA